MKLHLSHYFSALTITISLVTVTAFSKSADAATTVSTDEPLQTDANTRNYLPTGANALYSKVPGQSGAKVLAKATDLKTLATTADQGQTYFRGYRVAQTNDGNFYLKVVSFNKTYRGWIYVGTANPADDSTQVSNGLKSVQTFKEGTLDPNVANTTYYFSTPKSSTLTVTQPDWTQYKVGRNLSATTSYVNDSLNVTKVGTKQNNRDNNATYYYVQDVANPQVNGWIKASELTTVKQTYNY